MRFCARDAGLNNELLGVFPFTDVSFGFLLPQICMSLSFLEKFQKIPPDSFSESFQKAFPKSLPEKNIKYFPESFKNSRKFFRGVFSGIFKEYFCRIFLQSFLKKPFRKIPFFRSVHYRPFDQITMAKPARIDG